MKKLFLSLAIFLAATLVSMAQAPNSTAVVNKVQGFYIFTDSQPIAEYDVVGEFSTEGHDDKDIRSSGAQYQPVRDYIAKKVRAVNYLADGLILNFQNGGTDKAVVIKFKENAQNKNHAKVAQFQGLYLFVDSEPLNPTEYLSTSKVSLTLGSSQYSVLRDKLIKKAKKESPTAEGLVLKFVAGGSDVGDAVKFKK